MRLTTVRVRPARREKLAEIGCVHGAAGSVEVSIYGETVAVAHHREGETFEVVWLREGHDENAVMALLVAYELLVTDATSVGLVRA